MLPKPRKHPTTIPKRPKTYRQSCPLNKIQIEYKNRIDIIR